MTFNPIRELVTCLCSRGASLGWSPFVPSSAAYDVELRVQEPVLDTVLYCREEKIFVAAKKL
jgi:hypothetical protein